MTSVSHQNIHEIYFLWPSFRIAETKTPQRIWEGSNPVVSEFWFIELCQPSETVWYNEDFYCFSVFQCEPLSLSQFLLCFFYVFFTSRRNCFYKGSYWVSALNLFLEKPFFLCWVLRSHRILAAYVSTLAAVVWVSTPSGNLKKLWFHDRIVAKITFFALFFCVNLGDFC